MEPEQCRAARAWIGLSQTELAEAAGVSLSTVRDFELGKRRPIVATLGAMKAVLEDMGIGFAFSDNGSETKACGITFSAPENSTKN